MGVFLDVTMNINHSPQNTHPCQFSTKFFEIDTFMADNHKPAVSSKCQLIFFSPLTNLHCSINAVLFRRGCFLNRSQVRLTKNAHTPLCHHTLSPHTYSTPPYPPQSRPTLPPPPPLRPHFNLEAHCIPYSCLCFCVLLFHVCVCVCCYYMMRVVIPCSRVFLFHACVCTYSMFGFVFLPCLGVFSSFLSRRFGRPSRFRLDLGGPSPPRPPTCASAPASLSGATPGGGTALCCAASAPTSRQAST